jgi:hypothetical protein
MSLSKQNKAIIAANQLATYATQLQQLRQSMNDFVTQYNTQQYSGIWAAWPTAALNADGTLGTADVTPVAANPIRLAEMAKAVSKNQLTNAVNLVIQLQNLFGNLAVTQGNYNQTIDDLAN